MPFEQNDRAKLQYLISLASFMAKGDSQEEIKPIHLFVALIVLELVGYENSNFLDTYVEQGNEEDENSNDDPSPTRDLCVALEIGIYSDFIIFLKEETAKQLLAAQTIPRPDDEMLLEILAEDDEEDTVSLSLSKSAQSILACATDFRDCTKDLGEGHEKGLPYLTCIALATIGSNDPEIAKMIMDTNSTAEELTVDALNEAFGAGASRSVSYLKAGKNFLQALANNGLEHSVPAILVGMSNPKSGHAFVDTLLGILILGNQRGEDCEPAKVTINLAYGVALGIMCCDGGNLANEDNVIAVIEQDFLTRKKVTGTLKIALTQIVNDLPFTANA